MEVVRLVRDRKYCAVQNPNLGVCTAVREVAGTCTPLGVTPKIQTIPTDLYRLP